MTWEPESYIRGNFFQTEINHVFYKGLTVKPFGTVLDIGCGDGYYSSLLAKKLKKTRILGIDNSASMIEHANTRWANDMLSFQVHDIEDSLFPATFDFALSFWCLHWTNAELSFPNIFQALKHGGWMYAVLSSLSDNSMLQTWRELAKQSRYKDLEARYVNLNTQYGTYFFQIFNILNKLPFRQIKLKIQTCRVLLPHIDYFKHLIVTMPYIKTFSEDRVEGLIEDMLQAFHTICQRKYGGTLYYETRPIFIEALK